MKKVNKQSVLSKKTVLTKKKKTVPKTTQKWVVKNKTVNENFNKFLKLNGLINPIIAGIIFSIPIAPIIKVAIKLKFN